jgi:hypothetical protein
MAAGRYHSVKILLFTLQPQRAKRLCQLLLLLLHRCQLLLQLQCCPLQLQLSLLQL